MNEIPLTSGEYSFNEIYEEGVYKFRWFWEVGKYDLFLACVKNRNNKPSYLRLSLSYVRSNEFYEYGSDCMNKINILIYLKLIDKANCQIYLESLVCRT